MSEQEKKAESPVDDADLNLVADAKAKIAELQELFAKCAASSIAVKIDVTTVQSNCHRVPRPILNAEFLRYLG